MARPGAPAGGLPRTWQEPRTRAHALARFAPAALVAAMWVVLIAFDGGYFLRDWALPAVCLVVLLAAMVLAGGTVLPRARAARVVVLVLLAVAALNGLAILWARSPAAAWESADQLFLYALMAWVVALAPWTPRAAVVLGVAWAAGVVALCAATVISGSTTSDLSLSFSEDRFAEPLGYANASSALAALAIWPLVLVAARRGVPRALAAAALAGAAFLGAFALLPQSRAALLSSALAAVVVLAVAGDRRRVAVRLALLVVAVAAAAPDVVGVDVAVRDGEPVGPAFDDAARGMAIAAVLAAAGTLAVVTLESRWRPSARLRAGARRAAVLALAAAAIGGVAVAAVSAGSIRAEVADQWRDFRRGADPMPRDDRPRLLTSEPYQRYDYWRVAWGAFVDRPVAGIGGGNFEQRYTEYRDVVKPARFPHSIWFRVLAENGLLGALALAALLGVVAVGLLSGLRAAGDDARRATAAAVGVGTAFLAHASLDWLEEYAVLVGPALGLALAALVARAGAPAPTPARDRRARVLTVAGVAVLAPAAAAALLLPYLAVRDQDRARALALRGDVAGARAALDRAGSRNPLDPAPRLLEGFLALQLRDAGAASRAFTRALDVEDGWLPHFELALLAADAGRLGEARAHLRRARELNGRDELVIAVDRELDRGNRVDPLEVNALVLQDPLYRNRPVP